MKLLVQLILLLTMTLATFSNCYAGDAECSQKTNLENSQDSNASETHKDDRESISCVCALSCQNCLLDNSVSEIKSSELIFFLKTYAFNSNQYPEIILAEEEPPIN